MAKGRADYTQAVDVADQTVDRISTITKAPSGTTQVFKNGIAAGGTSLLHTVATGKSLYMTGLFIAINSLDTSSPVNISVQDENDIWQYYLFKTTPRATLDNSANMALSIDIIPPQEITEGWDIKIYTGNAGVLLSVSLSGWEE
ncbi:MAG TPA: hypothetical protein ENH40_05680 [Nitrospirae bacterium]|nr:hypothetical protein [Nitrospirota bacterium]